MTAFGERETQIIAENLDGAAAPATAPVTGYQAWLAGVGLSGAGVTVAVCDTGIDADANNNTIGHTDLRGRQTGFVDYTGGAVTTDTDGHGTNVAGIAFGSAATGQTEAGAPANFLWGQGVAPQSSYVTQNFLLANPQPATATLFQDAAANGPGVLVRTAPRPGWQLHHCSPPAPEVPWMTAVDPAPEVPGWGPVGSRLAARVPAAA